jgi:hypothetical protein
VDRMWGERSRVLSRNRELVLRGRNGPTKQTEQPLPLPSMGTIWASTTKQPLPSRRIHVTVLAAEGPFASSSPIILDVTSTLPRPVISNFHTHLSCRFGGVEHRGAQSSDACVTSIGFASSSVVGAIEWWSSRPRGGGRRPPLLKRRVLVVRGGSRVLGNHNGRSGKLLSSWV